MIELFSMAMPDPSFADYTILPPSSTIHPPYPPCTTTTTYSQSYYPILPVHFSQTLSEKLCMCEQPLRRWKVRKDSPNRGRVFLQCQSAWPIDPTGHTIVCPAWYWEDELEPKPGVMSFNDKYRTHPDMSAYFQSLYFLKKNKERVKEVLGMKVKLLTSDVGTQTGEVAECMEELRISEDSNDFSLRYSPELNNFVTPCISPRSHQRRFQSTAEDQLILFSGENRDNDG